MSILLEDAFRLRALVGSFMPVTTGVRRSLTEIQAEYDAGDKEALETLMRAWRGITALPPDDSRSFFVLGGYHGEPFRDQGATDPAWWGGYCEHGTVLFPTWHRAYLHALEKALQGVPGCAGVMLPFWDETSAHSLANGLPKALTSKTFELDGQVIPNPLRSFVIPVPIVDVLKGDGSLYGKPAGYETVRYPLSGLVGTDAERVSTATHNAKYPDDGTNVRLLNQNLTTWLNAAPVVDGKSLQGAFLHEQFVRCLDAPTYTLFSNTTSAGAYNSSHPADQHVVPLESPHNSIHLAIGGFDVPTADFDASPLEGANGDMGENDTAGLDPVFFFHHCFIDYAFWTWQRRHGSTHALEIDSNDKGADYSTAGQPPAGRKQGERLDANSGLNPFKTAAGTAMTSADVADIAKLGYSYGPGSLDAFAEPELTALAQDDSSTVSKRAIHVDGLDRSKLRGSFVISAFADVGGEMIAIGHEAVLSRWHVDGCANCMAHLTASADFPLPTEATAARDAKTDTVRVRVTTRNEVLRSRDSGVFAESLTGESPAFTVEIR
jgi:tyrosinase